MKNNSTKTLLIKTGAKIILRKGFNNTGILEILRETQVPKGSFYFYFTNKEDFGLQVIDYYYQILHSEFNNIQSNSSEKPLNRLRDLLNYYKKEFNNPKYSIGSPLGNLALEMSSLNEAFRKKLRRIYSRFNGVIESLLKEALNSGDISNKTEIAETAEFIVNSLEGTILRMKIEQSDRAFRIFIIRVFELLH